MRLMNEKLLRSRKLSDYRRKSMNLKRPQLSIVLLDRHRKGRIRIKINREAFRALWAILRILLARIRLNRL